jgi:translocation and assembly module TamB
MAGNGTETGRPGPRRAGRIPRILGWGGAAILCALAVGLAGVLVLATTSWGREQVRRAVLGQLEGRIQGQVGIESLEGNLLVNPELRNVSIVDAEGRPFVTFRSLSFRLSFRALLKRRLLLEDIDLRGVHIVLDQPPEEDWNLNRIFQPGLEPDEDPQETWGSWIEFREVRLSDGRVTVRTTWDPPPEPPSTAREEDDPEIRFPLERARVVEVPRGFQQVMEFRELEARIPRLLAAHPDTAGVTLEVADLRVVAEPFHPPHAEVRQFSGTLSTRNGTLQAQDVRTHLPASVLEGEGVFTPTTGEGRLELRASPLTLADLRVVHPDFPEGLAGRFVLRLERAASVTRLNLHDLDAQVGLGSLEGRAEVTWGDRRRLDDTRLAFSGIESGTLEKLVPGLRMPQVGTLAGRVEVDAVGDEEAARLDSWLQFDDPESRESRLLVRGIVGLDDQLRMRGLILRLAPLQTELVRGLVPPFPLRGVIEGSATVDGPVRRTFRVESDLALRDPETGVSRIGARGGIGLVEGVAFQDLHVEVSPLHVAALRELYRDAPLGGMIDGTARLDGTLDDSLAVRAELVHVEDDARSRIEGMADLLSGDRFRIRADATVHELALSTPGRFVPEAQLRGTATGHVHLTADPRAVLLQTRLSLPHDGGLEAQARLDRSLEDLHYDLHLELRDVDLTGISGRVPEATSIGGTASAEGRGTDLATMRASVVALLTDQHPPIPAELEVAGSVDEGLATVDSLSLRTRAFQGDLTGTFGLAGARAGELSYRISLDSLHLLPLPHPDPGGAVAPRPAPLQAALAEWEVAAEEAMRNAEVEFLATGREPTLPPPRDPLRITGIPPDTVAGRLEAEGTVRGNVHRFDVRGGLSMWDLLLRGHGLGTASAEYALSGMGDPGWEATLDARARSLLLAGFAYDSLALRADYRHGDPGREAPEGDKSGSGSIFLALDQQDMTRILGDAAFELAADAGRVRLDSLSILLPEAAYRMPRPGLVYWSDAEIGIEEVSLESDLGGLLRAHGTLFTDKEGELDLRIEDLEIGHLLTLLQEEVGVRGRLNLHIPVRGTTDAPRFQGEVSLLQAEIPGEIMADARAGVAYRDRLFTTELSVETDERRVLTGKAELPVDLTRRPAPGPRLLPDPIDIRAELHDLPLEAFSAVTHYLHEFRGRATGHLTISGTFEEPTREGALHLVAPSFLFPPLGIQVRDLAGAVRLDDHVLRVDSLVAHSRGPVRMTGELDLARLSEPSFDLAVEARDAQVMRTKDVRMRVDADLTVLGPFEAVEVTGRVRPRSGVIRIPETRELTAPRPLDLEDPDTFERVDRRLVEARDALLHRPPLLENLRTDLEVTVERDVWIRSKELNVEVYTPPRVGPLRLRMVGLHPRNLELAGTVETDRGRYEFMGRRFDVVSASATFPPGPELDPLIRLSAAHEVQLPGREAFDIRVVLDGTVQELETELESTAQPPLSQTDLMSLVVFGREAGSLLQQHGSVLSGQGTAGGPLMGNLAARAAQQFATVGTEALLAEVESEAARALDLDVLHIQPADDPAEIFTGRAGDVLRGTEIEAGRYVTSRLFVSGQARPTLVHPGARVEYRTDTGYVWRATWRPRFLPAVPTLARQPPDRASAFGTFLLREWRF